MCWRRFLGSQSMYPSDLLVEVVIEQTLNNVPVSNPWDICYFSICCADQESDFQEQHLFPSLYTHSNKHGKGTIRHAKSEIVG